MITLDDGRQIRKIFIAIPSQQDSVKIATMMLIADGMVDALIKNIAFSIKGYQGIAPISVCRDLIVAEFLVSDCDELVFIDDDLTWEAGALVRMLEHPVDFVGGCYPYRADPLNFPVRWKGGTKYLVAVDPLTNEPADNGLIEVEGFGFGFVRLTRRCIEKMIERYADDWYHQQYAPTKKCWPLFSFDIIDRRMWSEDLSFCRKWHQMGEKVWLDPNITFTHIGYKGFVGNLSRWLRENPSFEADLTSYHASTKSAA